MADNWRLITNEKLLLLAPRFGDTKGGGFMRFSFVKRIVKYALFHSYLALRSQLIKNRYKTPAGGWWGDCGSYSLLFFLLTYVVVCFDCELVYCTVVMLALFLKFLLVCFHKR